MNQKQKLMIFTDGACTYNGKDYAVGGIGIHFPNGEFKDISKGFKSGICTNQKTELWAIITAIRYIQTRIRMRDYQIHIYTDSAYSINCITKWVPGWIRNGWLTANKTRVMNKDMIEKLYGYYRKYDIVFHHVMAHTGKKDSISLANERADQLACQAKQRLMRKNQKRVDQYTSDVSTPEHFDVELISR